MQKKHLTKFNIHSWFKKKKKTSYKAGLEGTYLNIIKTIYDKPTTGILLSCEKLKTFPLKSGPRLECPLSPLLFSVVFAGSQHTRSHPWQGHEKTWQARQIRPPEISKSCPGAHLKDDTYLSDAYYTSSVQFSSVQSPTWLLPNFCDTGRRPSLISLQTKST